MTKVLEKCPHSVQDLSISNIKKIEGAKFFLSLE
jgi:hypothetical protein